MNQDHRPNCNGKAHARKGADTHCCDGKRRLLERTECPEDAPLTPATLFLRKPQHGCIAAVFAAEWRWASGTDA